MQKPSPGIARKAASGNSKVAMLALQKVKFLHESRHPHLTYSVIYKFLSIVQHCSYPSNQYFLILKLYNDYDLSIYI